MERVRAETCLCGLREKKRLAPVDRGRNRRGTCKTGRPRRPIKLRVSQPAAWMFEACLPFGPCVTSKLTFCPSFSVLKPLI